jgi:hypothetical protein
VERVDRDHPVRLMPVELSVDQHALQALARALSAEADGKKLRRDLSKSLRQAMEPLKHQVIGNLLGLDDTSPAAGTLSLRQSLVPLVKAQGRLSGRSTGARLRVGAKGAARGFDHAARRLNRAKGWRHPLFGNREVWIEQRATPVEWFDSATRKSHGEMRKAVLSAMEDMAQRIARKGPFK